MRGQSKIQQTNTVSEKSKEETSQHNTDQQVGEFTQESIPISPDGDSQQPNFVFGDTEESKDDMAKKRPVGRPIKKRLTDEAEQSKQIQQSSEKEGQQKKIESRSSLDRPTKVESKFNSIKQTNSNRSLAKRRSVDRSSQRAEEFMGESQEMFLQQQPDQSQQLMIETEQEVIQPRRSQDQGLERLGHHAPHLTPLSRPQVQSQEQNHRVRFRSVQFNTQDLNPPSQTLQPAQDRPRNASRNQELTTEQELKRQQLKDKKRAKVKKQAREMKRSLLNEIRNSDEFLRLVSLIPHTSQMFNFEYTDSDLDRIKPAEFQMLMQDKKNMIAMLLHQHTSAFNSIETSHLNQNSRTINVQRSNLMVEEEKVNFYQQVESEGNLDDGAVSGRDDEEAQIVSRVPAAQNEPKRGQREPEDQPQIRGTKGPVFQSQQYGTISDLVNQDYGTSAQIPENRKRQLSSLLMIKGLDQSLQSSLPSSNKPIKNIDFGLIKKSQPANLVEVKNYDAKTDNSDDRSQHLSPTARANDDEIMKSAQDDLSPSLNIPNGGLVMGEDYENQTKNDQGVNKLLSLTPKSNGLLAQNIMNKVGSQINQTIKTNAAKKKEAEERKKKDKEKKELEKRMCEDCGGLKPPPMSPRSRQQLKLAKQKMDAARRRAANRRDSEALERAVKGLPPPIRALLAICGIGVKKKKQQVISYHQLEKVIRTRHPVDPLSGERFDVWESITVADYNLKLIDACGCQTCFKCCSKYAKKAENLVTRKKDKGLEKPASMQDVPDGEAADSFQGLTKAALYVGEGPVLYLQIMKTLAILCVLLTIVNVPLLFMFSSTAGTRVNPLNMNSLFEHFTLGNVGFHVGTCRASHLNVSRGFELNQDLGPIQVNAKKVPINDPIAMDFKCPHGDEYIFNIAAWGFLLKIDLSNETFSDAVAKCKEIDPNYSQSDAEKLVFDEDATPWDPHAEHAEEDYSAAEEVVIDMLEESEKKKGLSVDEEYNEALLTPEIYPDAKNEYNIDPKCNLHNMFETQDNKKDFFMALEQACFLKNQCKLEPENLKINITVDEDNQIDNFDPNEVEIDPNQKWVVRTVRLTDLLSKNCYERIYKDEQTSPEFIGVPNCIRDYVVFPPLPSVHFHKEELGVVAVVSDMLSIFLMYYFFGKLKAINEEYLTILDNNVIRMKDFTIQVRRVRIDPATQDLRILRLKIWMHFTEILKKFRHGYNQMEVVDVQFSFSKHDKHFSMYKLQEIKTRLDVIKAKIDSGECTPGEAFSMETERRELQEKYERFENRYLLAIELEEKWAFNVSSCPANKLLHFVEYTYVTFKSNQAPAKAIELFVKEPATSKFARMIFCIEDEIKDNVELEEQNLEVGRTVDPDQILWNNIGFSIEEQNARAVIAIIVQILTAIFALLVTLLMGKLQAVTDRGSPSCEEPDMTENVMAGAGDALVAQELATGIRLVQAKKANPDISDIQIQELRDNYVLADEMICFCKSITRGGYTFWNLFLVPWDDYANEESGEVPPNYCLKWIGDTIFMQIISIITETSAVILNGLIASAFSHLSKFKKKHTSIEEQSTGFAQIFFMEYFNMGIVMLITSFDPSGTTQSLAGQDEPKIYKGFESSWYASAGKKLCFSLFMSAFATNLGEIQKLVSALRDRLKDRGFKPNLKRDLEDEDDDKVNSKCETQAEAEELYTGGEFEGEKTFSRMMSTLIVIVSYSSGMPVLYFVGAFFFGATYLVNKTVLFKYYQKSLTLNRVVPQFSMQFLSVSLGLHILFGCFMLTNPGLFETVSPAGTAFELPTLPFNPGDALREQFDLEAEEEERTIAPEENLKEQTDPTKAIIDKVSERMLFVHQQIYLLFVVGMIAAIFAGRFAWDVLDFIVNKLTMFIVAIVKLIFKGIKYVVTQIVEKVLEMRILCRRKVRQTVKFLNQKIKSKKIQYGLQAAPEQEEEDDNNVIEVMTEDQKHKRIYYDFLIKPEQNESNRIISLYNQLMSLQGLIVATSQLKHVKLTGFLKKKVHEIEVFQTSVYPLRYYSIDFEDQRMFVKHAKDIADDDEFDSKMICFREIINCYKMTDDELDECKNNGYYPADKPYPFYLQTIDRKFELCSQTEQERDLWMTALEYIAVCVKESKSLKFDIFKRARTLQADIAAKRNEQISEFERKKEQSKKKKIDKEIQRFIDQIWDVYDEDGSGGLDIEETKVFLLDNWDHLGNRKPFDAPGFEKAFKEFDEDGSGTIDKEEMVEFLDAFLNADQDDASASVFDTVRKSWSTGDGPGLKKGSLMLVKGVSSKQYQRAVEERDKQMKGMRTQEKIKFLKEWHENMRAKQAELDADNLGGEESEDPDEVRKRDEMLARYRIQIEKPYLSDNIFMELSIINLQHFYDRARKEQKDINKYFLVTEENEKIVLTPVSRGKKKPELRIQFEERCFMTKLSHLEVVTYLDMMKKRVADIEEVIDLHFDMVKIVILKEKQGRLYRQMKKDQEDQKKNKGGAQETDKTSRSKQAKSGRKSGTEAGEKEKEEDVEEGIILKAIKEQLADDPELQFENPFICTYDKKLKQLEDYEDALLKTDRQKKVNRRKQQTICRMQGSLTQSYFLWDAQQHKTARGIHYELESRVKEEESENMEEIEKIYKEMAGAQQKEALMRVEEEARAKLNH